MNPQIDRIQTSLILLALAFFAPTLVSGPLDAPVERIIERADLGNASVAVHAIDLRSGAELISYRANADMIPASNMKLITSGAALAVLGTDFQFRTEIKIDESAAPPNIVFVGSGDPALGDPVLLEREGVGMTLPLLFDRIATLMDDSGHAEFGELIVDDRVFDRELVHPSWPIDQLNRWYCAEVGGMNLRRNVVTVYAEPTSQNGSPRTRMLPDAPWISLGNRGRTDKKGNNTAWVSRPQPSDSMTLLGKVRSRVEIDVSIHNPPLFAGRVLATEFHRRGVSFTSEQPYEAARLVTQGEQISEDARTIAVVTTPIADILNRVNQDSHNLYAECVFKRLGNSVSGEPGSWINGASVTRMVISDALGPDYAQATTVADGSGMSRDNRVRPSMLTAWMRWISKEDERWNVFKSSLASPGVGTLRTRFRGDDELNSELHAKSGYLSGVYSLSGVMTHPSTGREIAFSILLNDVPRGRQARNAKPLHAAILKEIDAYLVPEATPANLGG
ncbi:MAG: D-alanyl-D-alanine carboxypeptidase/D-alanyl-D-alanine-endopeptidase [Phycisphaerales bacterium]